MVKVDFLALETDLWLYGTRAFLEAIQHAVADAESREAQELKRRAESEAWEPGEYFAESDVLREKFQHWLPRLSAYSVIILLYSLVETQLDAYAHRLQRARGLTLGVGDSHRKGTERAKKYIIKVVGIDIANDLGWREVSNLQKLRNIIVHRRGRQGDSRDQQLVQGLLNQYPQDLSLTAAGLSDRELLVTFRLCSHFLREVEAFFHRFCAAAGFQNKGWSDE